jgi:sugar lactone lactonase YvrE
MAAATSRITIATTFSSPANNLDAGFHASKTQFHPSKMCFRPNAIARLAGADKNPASSRTRSPVQMHHIIQESFVQNKKRTFLQRDALLLVAVLLLQGCKLDSTPDAFSFATQTNVAPDTPIESESVTITGINFPAPLSITGGEYSIDGGAYDDSPGTVKNNQLVRIRVQSSGESTGDASATLAIGGVSATFMVKTVTTFTSVSTLAATGLANTTDGLAVGANGDIYVSGGPGGQNILRITPEGEASVFASGFNTNGSYFDSHGNLYVANYDESSVRKITPKGVVTTFASSLDGPAGVWVDPKDNVFVSLFGANFSGVGATVLKITPDGVVATYATGGGLQDVIGIVGDENGRVYASNWAGGSLFDITDGNVTPLAATVGRTNMICYSNGYIYMPGPADARIHRVSLEGAVETFIGTTTRQTIDGPLAIADFERPNSCAFTPDGTILYIMDRDNGLLRKVDSGTP